MKIKFNWKQIRDDILFAIPIGFVCGIVWYFICLNYIDKIL